jgi:Icc-related predicted phosphoesterase
VIRLVFLSDTHAQHGRVVVPDGDVLVHAGDFTRQGAFEDVAHFDRFLAGLPHAHKVVIAGNHDFCFERTPDRAREVLTHCTYLEDSGATVAGIRFWGSPWQPFFFDWAFNLPRGEKLREKWAKIPEDVDVLVTHGPPKGILDRTYDGRREGCEELRARVDRIDPPVHVFGHIHEAAGVESRGRTLFVNAATCTLRYEPTNPPIVVDYDPEHRRAQCVP